MTAHWFALANEDNRHDITALRPILASGHNELTFFAV